MRHLLKSSAAAGLLLSLSSLSVNAVNQKDFSGVMSPDGKQFIYYSYRNGALPDLYINSIDGNREKQMTNTPELWEIEPDWSDNGEMIAFARGPSMGELQIFTMKPDGSEMQQRTHADGSSSGPHISPDGSYIVFNRIYRKLGQSKLVKLNLATGQEKELTDITSVAAMKPKVSPDGSKIAFIAAEKLGQPNDVYVMNADGSRLKKISDTDINESMIEWSATNDKLFVSGSAPGKNNAIYTLNLKKKTLKPFSNDPFNHFFFMSLSADGKTLMYDTGDWNSNFFVHTEELADTNATPQQVSGIQFLQHQKQLLNDYLGTFVGTWESIATEGNGKGKSRKIYTFRWGADKKSLRVTAKYFWGQEPTGTAYGHMTLDRDNLKTYLNLVMDNGTAVMHQQSNAGEPGKLLFDVVSTGDGSQMPHDFKKQWIKDNAGSWRSKTTYKIKGEWKTISVDTFSRKD